MVSCSKVGSSGEETIDVIDDNDNIFPVIAFKTSSNQVYSSGDSIIVEGIVTDEKKLYKGKVEIKNDVNSLIVAEGYYETHFLAPSIFVLAIKPWSRRTTDFSVHVDSRIMGGMFLCNIKSESEPLEFVDDFQNRFPASSIVNF